MDRAVYDRMAEIDADPFADAKLAMDAEGQFDAVRITAP